MIFMAIWGLVGEATRAADEWRLQVAPELDAHGERRVRRRGGLLDWWTAGMALLTLGLRHWITASMRPRAA